MKNQSSKLQFGKSSITELNSKQLTKIHGGSTTDFFINWLQDQVDEAIEEMSKWI